MSAPDLDVIEQAFRDGAKSLTDVATRTGLCFESVCLSFNNGLLKGYWKIVLPDGEI